MNREKNVNSPAIYFCTPILVSSFTVQCYECFRLLFSWNVVSKFEHTPTFHSPEINSSVLDWTRIQMHKAVPRGCSKIGLPLLTSLTTVQTNFLPYGPTIHYPCLSWVEMFTPINYFYWDLSFSESITSLKRKLTWSLLTWWEIAPSLHFYPPQESNRNCFLGRLIPHEDILSWHASGDAFRALGQHIPCIRTSHCRLSKLGFIFISCICVLLLQE